MTLINVKDCHEAKILSVVKFFEGLFSIIYNNEKFFLFFTMIDKTLKTQVDRITIIVMNYFKN